MVRKINTSEVREARLDEELQEELKQHGATAETPEGEELEAPEANLTAEEKTWKKRHSDLRSYSQKQINDLQKELETIKAQLNDATKKQIKFPKTEEEVEDWIKKYPDVAGIVETIALKKVSELRKEVEEKEQKNLKDKYQVELDKWMNKIVKEHPDFYELRDDDKFVEWVMKQPKYVRAAFGEGIPFDELGDAAQTIISAIKLYKIDNGKKPVKNDSKDAARSIQTKGTRSAPQGDKDPNLIYESDFINMHPREYEKHDEKIMKAMKEGRFIADVTGAAR